MEKTYIASNTQLKKIYEAGRDAHSLGDTITDLELKVVPAVNMQEPVTAKWFRDNGFTEYGGVAGSFSINLQATKHNSKDLSFMYNNDTSEAQWYAMFTEHDPSDRSGAEVVCLRKDIRYTHQILSLLAALKPLPEGKEDLSGE